MSTNLDVLERDVVLARRRIQDDLANLRGPATASLKRDLTTSADGVLNDIKDRLAANPVATVAIGAGIAWRLVHNPPIASLLVGYGLYSLVRTDPRRPTAMAGLASEAVSAGEAFVDRATQLAREGRAAATEGLRTAQETASQAADTVSRAAGAWAARATEGLHTAQETASQTADTVSRAAGEWTARATEGLHTAQETASQTADTVSRTAGEWTARATQTAAEAAATVRARAPQLVEAAQRDKDTYLLGFAAAALAAAIGISARRRLQ